MSTMPTSYRHGNEAGRKQILPRRRDGGPGWCRAEHAEAATSQRDEHASE